MKFFKDCIIYDWQIGLFYRNGQFVSTKSAGKYRLRTFLNEEIMVYGVRPTTTSFNAGEVQSADKIGVTIYGNIRRKIVDPKKLINISADNESLIREWATAIVKQFAIKLSIEDLLNSSEQMSKKIESELSKKLKDVGIEIVETPVITMILPRSIKRALEFEIVAKKRALAELEEARGKTATLRHLANSSKLIQENPALYKLLLSQKVRSLNIAIDENNQ